MTEKTVDRWAKIMQGRPARDPERIDRVLALLREHWKRYPDQRLAQILGNAYPDGPVQNYFMEDDEVEAWLREQAAKEGP